MEKFVFKKNITCKLLSLKHIRDVKDHQRTYLEIIIKKLVRENPKLLMLAPHDLTLIRK